MIEVTQPMRELAADMCVLPELRDMVRAGKCDEGHYVQTARKHILAAEQRGMIADKWQPIETAPKDGTIIDVWVDGEFPSRITDVQWRKPTESEWWVHGGDTIEKPDATWHDAWGPFGQDSQPTHWQPLPAPPAIATMPMTAGGSDA